MTEGLLNMVEMAFRAYDPCFGCATHSLPGQMPLEITVHDADGNPVDLLRQFCYIVKVGEERRVLRYFDGTRRGHYEIEPIGRSR